MVSIHLKNISQNGFIFPKLGWILKIFELPPTKKISYVEFEHPSPAILWKGSSWIGSEILRSVRTEKNTSVRHFQGCFNHQLPVQVGCSELRGVSFMTFHHQNICQIEPPRTRSTRVIHCQCYDLRLRLHRSRFQVSQVLAHWAIWRLPKAACWWITI